MERDTSSSPATGVGEPTAPSAPRHDAGGRGARGGGTVWRRIAATLLWNGAPTTREVLAVGTGLVGLSLAVFSAHIAHGGFISDDWWQHADTRRLRAEHGFFGAVREFHEQKPIRGRPFDAFYTTAVDNLLGAGPRPYIVWTVVAWALVAVLFYVLLRQVGLERVHAAGVAALLVLFPASDSVRLWPTASAYSVALLLFLLGATVALRGMRTRGRLAVALHGVAVSCYLLSLLTRESTVAFVLLTVLLYRLRGTWSAALRRWAADLGAVAGAAAIVVALSIDRTIQPLSKQFDHARTILEDVRQLVVTAGVQSGAARLPTLGVALLLAVAVVAWRFLPTRDEARGELGRWLVVCGAGAVVLAAAYAPFVPASAYYRPIPFSALANRTNIFATPGYALFFYALAMLGAVLVLRGLPHWRLWAVGLVVVVVVGLGATWVRQLERDRRVWNQASARAEDILAELKIRLPSPPPGTTIYLFGTEPGIGGVPVFEAAWDLNGAVKLNWDEPTLRGIPWALLLGDPSVEFAHRQRGVSCGPHLLQPYGRNLGPADASAYGRAVFVDLASDSVRWIGTRAVCRAAVARFVTPILPKTDDQA